MHGDECGGAPGVHGHGRPFEAEGVRDAAGGDAGDRAGDQVAFEALRDLAGRAVALVGDADEDAGGAAAQAVRRDAGPLQGLPGGLQQQALLRVHRGRLTRRDAEEGGVELGRVVQETAVTGVGGSRPVGIGVVQALHVPAAVDGQTGYGVGLAEDEPPEVLGRVRPAGEAAAHGDDGDRLVLVRRAGRGQCRERGGLLVGAVVDEVSAQVAYEITDVGVVEDDGGGQGQAGRLVEPVAQFDRGEGVEAEFAEGAGGGDVVAVGVAEDGGDLGADHVGQDAVAFGGGQGGEFGAQSSAPVGGAVEDGFVGLHGLGDFGNLVQQRPGVGGREDGDEAFPVDVGDREEGLVVVECLLETGHGDVGVHERDAAPPQLLAHDVDGHAAALGAPDAPRQGRAGQTAGPAVLGEGVHVGVGGGVGAVVAAAPRSGHGRVEDEGVQPVVVEDFVEIRRPEEFGAGALGEEVEVGVGERGEHSDARGVHDGADGGPVGFDVLDEAAERVPVGRVAGGDGHPTAEVGQLAFQFGRSGGLGTVPARQHQVLGTVAGQQPGGVGAEATGAAGDERGAAGAPGTRRAATGERRADQAADIRATRAQGDLVLVTPGGQEGDHCACGVVVDVRGQVDQSAPAPGLFEGHDTTEAPQGALDRVVDDVALRTGCDGPTREDPRPGLDAGIQQTLHQEQRGDHGRGGAGVGRRRALIESEQGDDAPHGGPVGPGDGAEPGDDLLAVEVVGGHDEGDDGRPGPAQCAGHTADQR